MEKQSISLKECFRLNLRMWKMSHEKCPQIFPCKLAAGLLKALTPYTAIYLSAQIINELTGAGNLDVIIRLILWLVISQAALAFLNGAAERWNSYIYQTLFPIGDQIYMEKGLDMDFSVIDAQETYDLFSQILQNENYMGWGIRKSVLLFDRLIAGLFQTIGGAALTVSLFTSPIPAGNSMEFLNHPLFAVLIAGLMLTLTWLSSLASKKSMGYWIRFSEEAKFSNRLFNYFSENAVTEPHRFLDLRIYNQTNQIILPTMRSNSSFTFNSILARAARGPMGLYIVVSSAVSRILTGCIYLFVCLKALGGAFGVGSVTQYVGAVTNCFLGLNNLLKTIEELRTNAEFLVPVCEFLDLPNEMFRGSLTTEKRSDRQYDVEFRDVSFRYPGSEQYALRHVNMKFRVGSRLAVVGMNGSGKTTFIKLLCRLYDPTEGQILLNGIDIRKYRYDEYIQIFSIVFQDFQLFALPLGQNVSGAMHYDKEQVMWELIHAGFEERLSSMPDGLDTWLYKTMEPSGVDVSGGEAQKLAIARALYKDAPFIILDEPTAALDPIAEAEIYSRFDEIAGDKTAIYISHRLSSCRFCDEIAVFHEGAVIQQGTHAELVADENGKYFELWNAQAQYYVKAVAG